MEKRETILENCGTKKVFFTVEKKFNLDGSDGLRFYWNDFENWTKMFCKCVQKGCLVMVWDAIFYIGKIWLVGIGAKMNSDYQKTIFTKQSSLCGESFVWKRMSFTAEKCLWTHTNQECRVSVWQLNWCSVMDGNISWIKHNWKHLGSISERCLQKIASELDFELPTRRNYGCMEEPTICISLQFIFLLHFTSHICYSE